MKRTVNWRMQEMADITAKRFRDHVKPHERLTSQQQMHQGDIERAWERGFITGLGLAVFVGVASWLLR